MNPSHTQGRIVAGALLLFGVVAAVTQWTRAFAFGHDSWQLSEWLINYQGGFVRRGLSGEIFFRISGWSGLPANALVIWISYLVYGWFAFALCRQARSTFSPLLLLSGILLGFPATQDAIVRKDCLLLLVFLLTAKVMMAREAGFGKRLAVAALSSFAVLCHEGYAIFSLPALLLCATAPAEESGRRYGKVRYLVPAATLGAFILTVLHKGTPAVALAINQSWLGLWEKTNPGDDSIHQPAAAIQAIGWTPSEGLAPSWNLLASGFYQPAAWLMLFGAAFVYLYALARPQSGDTEATRRWGGILLLQLIAIGPFFLLGFDYGRWLFLWAASSVALHSLGFSPPHVLMRFADILCHSQPLGRIRRWAGTNPWPLLFLGIPVCWNLHEFLRASAVGRLISALREFF